LRGEIKKEAAEARNRRKEEPKRINHIQSNRNQIKLNRAKSNKIKPINYDQYLDSPNNQKKHQNMVFHKQIVSVDSPNQTNKTKPNEPEPNQMEPNQSNQNEPNQIK
jgi:hypothetical protein